jgi:hypothetical protein
MSDEKPPLPVLVGKTISTSREPGNPRVKLGYVTRDIVFSLGYGVVIYIATIYVAGYLSTKQHSILSKGCFNVLAMAGYVLVASWGRQPVRNRVLRLLYDVIGLELVYHGVSWIFLGTQIFMVTGGSILRMVITNLIVAGIGVGISCVIAPYARTVTSNEERE